MPVPIQHGGIADRLRNFLKLVGRAGTTMDEVLVPVVNVQTLDQQPWRTNDRAFMSLAITQIAVVATSGWIGVAMPINAKGVAVVQRVRVNNQSGAVQTVSLRVIDNPATGLATFASSNVFNVENWSADPPGSVSRLTPLQFSGTKVVGVEVNLGRFQVPIDATLTLDLTIALRSGLLGDPAATRAIAILNETVNQRLDVSWQGTFYPDAI